MKGFESPIVFVTMIRTSSQFDASNKHIINVKLSFTVLEAKPINRFSGSITNLTSLEQTSYHTRYRA